MQAGVEEAGVAGEGERGAGIGGVAEASSATGAATGVAPAILTARGASFVRGAGACMLSATEVGEDAG